MGLPQTAGIGRDYPIAARIATLAQVAKEPHRGIAARIPALEEIRLIGVEYTVPEVAATFASRKGRSPEIALHCAQTQPNLLRNGRGRPALAVQGPDLLMQPLPACLALCRALLRWQRDVVRWYGYGHRPLGQRHRLLAHRLIDGVEGVAVGEEHLVQRFPEILQEMKAVGDLGGSGGPLARTFGIGGGAIACDHLDTRMLPEPLGQGLAGTIWEKCHGLATFQIDQHGAIGLAFA